MTYDAKIIIDTARSLSASEREDILEAMLASLRQEAAPDVDRAWRNLIDERLAELDRGEVETFDFDEAISDLRRK